MSKDNPDHLLTSPDSPFQHGRKKRGKTAPTLHTEAIGDTGVASFVGVCNFKVTKHFKANDETNQDKKIEMIEISLKYYVGKVRLTKEAYK